MKVLWIVLGVLFGLCLLCAGGGYFVFNKAKGILTDATQSGDNSFRAIATGWDEKVFKEQATPGFAGQTGESGIAALAQKYKASFGPVKGAFTSHIVGINARNNNGVSQTQATWTADVTFEKGSGSVTMDLVNMNEKWLVSSLSIRSTGPSH